MAGWEKRGIKIRKSIKNTTMRKLDLIQIENIEGGDWINWIDGGCAVLGVAALYSKGVILANPVGGSAGIFCAGWALGRWMGSQEVL